MRKKYEIKRDGKLYKVVVTYVAFNMFEVKVYEIIRPTWKIFRTTIFSIGDNRFIMKDDAEIQWQVNDAVDTIFKNYKKDIEEDKKIDNYFSK